MCFTSIADIADFARAMSAADKVEAICASARPTLLFSRKVVPDDPLPVGATKFGGFPDLPTGTSWPERPAWPDAGGKVDELLESATRRRAWTEQMNGPPIPHFTQPTQADIDAVLPRARESAKVLLEPFPLAFVAQFDLEALARLDGFDPALPRSGLLSFFADITWEGHAGRHWVYWHDVTADTLMRTPPPDRLVAYHRAHNHCGAPAWESATTSELMQPSSTITIPDHWQDPGIEGAIDTMALVEADLSAIAHEPSSAPAPSMSIFDRLGDRLGGWPVTLQFQHPEDCAAKRHGGDRVRVPGQTPWRNLYSCEPHSGAGRFMHARRGGGDMIYIMIREDDLKARRFDAVETVAIYD